MTPSRLSRRFVVGLIGALSLVAGACGSDDSADTTAPAATAAPGTAAQDTAAPDTAAVDTAAPDTAAPDTAAPDTTAAVDTFEGALLGVLELTAGDCSSGTPTGSYFQMVQPLGTAEAGPFIPNGDSTCADTNYTLLEPGTAGGLIVGGWQAAPDPAFDANGNGLADAIFAPVTFFGVAFAGATDAAEAQPSISAAAGVLSGDLSAFTAYYGGGAFNQGAPKPDGSGDGPTGTIDATTGAYVLEWTSLIVGGSFDGFTGVWHLEGNFTPAL